MPRRRSRCRLVSALILLSCSSVATAFTTPLHRISRTRALLLPPKTDSVGLLHYDDDSIDPSDPSSSWLRWMSGGVKSAGRTIQREPDERTGGTRTDRYSSRDWLHTTIGYVSLLQDVSLSQDFVKCVSCPYRIFLTTCFFLSQTLGICHPSRHWASRGLPDFVGDVYRHHLCALNDTKSLHCTKNVSLNDAAFAHDERLGSFASL